MRRSIVWTVPAVFLMLPGVSSGVRAQDLPRPAPAFELGVYGGGTYSSDWFESRVETMTADGMTNGSDGEGFGINAAWTFGGIATWYFNPVFGLRAHYGYMPSDYPVDAEGLPLNNHLYDLSAVFRPWAGSTGSGFLASSYLFVGGGGMTANPAGSRGSCEAGTLARGACLAMAGDGGSVGQGVAGFGFNVFDFSGLGLFAELAGHAYDSPVHVDGGFMPPRVNPLVAGQTIVVADDEWTFAGRLVAGIRYGFGDLMPPPRVMVTAPPPPPAPPPVVRPASVPVSLCVISGTELTTVAGVYDPATRDTTVGGERFAARYAATGPTYAAGTSWFIGSDSVRFNDVTYVKFGVVREMQPKLLRRVGDVMGTSVFMETSPVAPATVIYVPTRPNCEFQPYTARAAVRPRG